MALTALRRARLEQGLTQLDIALKARTAPSRISVLERAILQPTPEEITRLAVVLGVDASVLTADRRPKIVEEEV